MNDRYVCAFRGARDHYQAAIALAECDRLETLITDAYATPSVRAWLSRLPLPMRNTILARHADGVPNERVRCLWDVAFIEQVRHRLGFSPRSTWLSLDRRFGEAAASEARRTRAHLLMYSPYAWEAFTVPYSHHPRRVLFQYHPHPLLEERLLAEDRRRFPGIGESFAEGRARHDAHLLARERESWRHADAIVCSSAFTMQSLVEAGCDPSICHVVPYGVRLPEPADPPSPPAVFEALFVGSGGQRKGLHHLLLAWQRAALREARLTLVCRVIDHAIRLLARSIPGVEIRHGASASELDAMYARSTLFVMPSMVEGFGHVYLEALARGCPVLGTPNSALPDLGAEADGIFVTPAGDIDQLTAMLQRLASGLRSDTAIRAASRRTAERHPWSNFRRELRATLQ